MNTNLPRRSYLATGFQTYKEINILWNCEHVSVAVYSCKRRERTWKENFEVPDKSLFGCDTVSTCKKQLPAGEYCLQLQDSTSEE